MQSKLYRYGHLDEPFYRCLPPHHPCHCSPAPAPEAPYTTRASACKRTPLFGLACCTLPVNLCRQKPSRSSMPGRGYEAAGSTYDPADSILLSWKALMSSCRKTLNRHTMQGVVAEGAAVGAGGLITGRRGGPSDTGGPGRDTSPGSPESVPLLPLPGSAQLRKPGRVLLLLQLLRLCWGVESRPKGERSMHCTVRMCSSPILYSSMLGQHSA